MAIKNKLYNLTKQLETAKKQYNESCNPYERVKIKEEMQRLERKLSRAKAQYEKYYD